MRRDNDVVLETSLTFVDVNKNKKEKENTNVSNEPLSFDLACKFKEQSDFAGFSNMSTSTDMATKVKEVAIDEAERIKQLGTQAIQSRAYLYPVKVTFPLPER